MRLIRITVLVLIVVSSFATLSFATTASQKAMWAKPSYQQALLSALAVNQDGTIRFQNWSKAQRLLGGDFAQAAGEMNFFNSKILSGEIKGFKSVDQLKHFELTEPVPQFITTSTLCSRTCYQGTCCCRGWWIFCWGYCNC